MYLVRKHGHVQFQQARINLAAILGPYILISCCDIKSLHPLSLATTPSWKFSGLLKLEVKPWLNNPSLWPVTGLRCGGWGRGPGEHGALTGLINSDSVTHILAPADQWPLYTQTDHTHGARSRHRTRTLASGCPSIYQVWNASVLPFFA